MKKLTIGLVLSIVMLALFACGAPQATQAPQAPQAAGVQPVPVEAIVGFEWQWGALVESQPSTQSLVPDKEKYTLVLMPDGVYTFTADCNSGSGKYAVDGSSITLAPGVSTLAECGPDSLYSNYLNLLSQVNAFGLMNDQLVLSTPDEGAKMFFYNGGQVTGEYDVSSVASGVGIDLNSITLNTQGLNQDITTTLAIETPYGNPSGTGAKGLPAHVQVSLGSAENIDTAPTLYIIPVEAYKQMWEANGDASVTGTLAKLESLLTEQPALPQFGLPILPFERAIGVNDLAVQGAYLTSANGNGVRFVGRLSPDSAPVSNAGLYYIYLGLSQDGNYLIAFFYPLTTTALPADGSVSTDDQSAAAADFSTYLAAKAAYLNGTLPVDWSPNLTTLDELIKSLSFNTGG